MSIIILIMTVVVRIPLSTGVIWHLSDLEIDHTCCMSSAQAHWTKHDLSAIAWLSAPPDCFINWTQLILAVRQTGPSVVQVQLLHGLILLLWPKSNLILFTKQDLRFSRQTLKSIAGKLEQATRGFLCEDISRL